MRGNEYFYPWKCSINVNKCNETLWWCFPAPLWCFRKSYHPRVDSGPMTLWSGGGGAVGWDRGRKETGSGPRVSFSPDSSRVFTRHNPVDSLPHHPWLMHPTHEKDINDFLLLLFLSPHNKVGLPLLPHHPLHFEWNAKTMKLLCSTSVIFSYVNFIYQINIFFFHCHDCKEIQPVPPKGNQSWALTGRIDVEVETPILWPPDAKSWLIWKDPYVGKDWGQKEKGTTEDEMVG